MRLLLFSVILIQIAQIAFTPVQAYPYPSDAVSISPQEEIRGLEEDNHRLQGEIKQLNQQIEDQSIQDSKIVSMLIAISIGLGCIIIALAVVFIKNRSPRNKIS